MISVLNPTAECNSFKVLLVEDNGAEAELIEEFLLETNVARSLSQRISVSRADRLSKAQHLLLQEKFDVILLDLSLPDSQDLSTIVKIQEYSINTPIVVLTARNDEELAVRPASPPTAQIPSSRTTPGCISSTRNKLITPQRSSTDGFSGQTATSTFHMLSAHTICRRPIGRNGPSRTSASDSIARRCNARSTALATRTRSAASTT